MYKIPKVANDGDIKINIDAVLEQLKNTILKMDFDKAKPLLYWLNDWGGHFLTEEHQFDPEKLIRYERGMVVQAHLGFKVGSEQGGLHYALVVENNNGLGDKVVTVIPLRSLKDKEKPEDVDERFELFLGYGIFKLDIVETENSIVKKEKMLASLTADKINNGKKITIINKTLVKLKKKLNSLKKGTVAQVGQICCLSKLRIYHPTYKGDELSTVKIESLLLDQIDEIVSRLFLKPKSGK